MSTLLRMIMSANSIWSTMRSDTVRSSSGVTSSRRAEIRSAVSKSLSMVKVSTTVTVVSSLANFSRPPASLLQRISMASILGWTSQSYSCLRSLTMSSSRPSGPPSPSSARRPICSASLLSKVSATCSGSLIPLLSMMM